MALAFHQVDAFSDRPFGGNPAMVYRLDAWLSDELMQRIAAEHNLAETAFVVRKNIRDQCSGTGREETNAEPM